MSLHPTSFADWQHYPSTQDPIHIAWLKNAKKSKTAFAVADIEGVEISHKKFLTGVLLFSRKIEVYSPEQNVGLLLPSSGGGAIASMAILSLGKTIVNLNFTAGDLWMLAAVFSWGLYSVLLKKIDSSLSQLATLEVMIFIGLIFIFPFYMLESLNNSFFPKDTN